MTIQGLVVCVDYADYLERSIDVWRRGLDDLLVVTTAADEATIRLCEEHETDWYETDAFTASGSVFNKAAALSEAVERIDWAGWVLNIDADIVPPADWRERVNAARCEPGYLYGCMRCAESGRPVADSELASYFHLWHTSDPLVQRRPLWDVSWRHAGGYDSEFSFRWGPARWRRLPLRVTHLGQPGVNWWGRNNPDAHEEMMRQRRVFRGIGPCERTDGKTAIDWK